MGAFVRRTTVLLQRAALDFNITNRNKILFDVFIGVANKSLSSDQISCGTDRRRSPLHRSRFASGIALTFAYSPSLLTHQLTKFHRYPSGRHPNFCRLSFAATGRGVAASTEVSQGEQIHHAFLELSGLASWRVCLPKGYPICTSS